MFHVWSGSERRIAPPAQARSGARRDRDRQVRRRTMSRIKHDGIAGRGGAHRRGARRDEPRRSPRRVRAGGFRLGDHRQPEPAPGAAGGCDVQSRQRVARARPSRSTRSTTYQTMTGFGASFTDSSAWLVANSPLRSQIMTKLFDPHERHRPGLPAAADRGVGLLAVAVQLRRHARRPDRSRRWPTSPSRTTGLHPAGAPAGAEHQPEHHDHGHAVEPAGVDEDERLDDRRHPQQRRLPGASPTTSPSSSRPTTPRACRSR